MSCLYPGHAGDRLSQNRLRKWAGKPTVPTNFHWIDLTRTLNRPLTQAVLTLFFMHVLC